MLLGEISLKLRKVQPDYSVPHFTTVACTSHQTTLPMLCRRLLRSKKENISAQKMKYFHNRFQAKTERKGIGQLPYKNYLLDDLGEIKEAHTLYINCLSHALHDTVRRLRQPDHFPVFGLLLSMVNCAQLIVYRRNKGLSIDTRIKT